MKKWLWFLCLPCFAQITYVTSKTTALTANPEVITVQQIAASSTSKSLQFVSASVDCSVACTVTLERNGTTASSTSLTPAQLNPEQAVVATATAFSASNVGVGTVVLRQAIPAASIVVFDLSNIKIPAGCGVACNFTIRTNSITGTVNINIKHQEISIP